MNKWYEKSGSEGDVVVSTRIRLARNLKNYPFPVKMSQEQRAAVDKAVRDALLQGNSILQEQFSYIDMGKLDQTEAVSLVERHLVSPEFIAEREGRGLLLIDDETASIMVNEEDHVRLQVMQQGLALDSVYEMADRLDTLLDQELHFAFDDRLGYLTQCPTNLGTGMRASLMMHLPALQESGSMSRIASNLSKLGLAIRGLYGEGTAPKGAMYQLSNQVTLGLSEKEAIGNLHDIAMQIIAQERTERDTLTRTLETQDAICRSLGILQNAKMLSNEEFMNLISNVRLGVSTGVLNGISYDVINGLIADAQPATLMKNSGQKLSSSERDKLRAELVQNRLFAMK